MLLLGKLLCNAGTFSSTVTGLNREYLLFLSRYTSFLNIMHYSNEHFQESVLEYLMNMIISLYQ